MQTSAEFPERVPYRICHACDLQTFVDIVMEQCKEPGVVFRGQTSDWPLLPKLARPDLGLHDEALEAERMLFTDFRRCSRPYLPSSNLDDWSLLAIAQHHGLPTRLLDWTENPLAALWFAVRDASTTRGPAVVWSVWYDEKLLVNPEQEPSPFEIERSRFIRPPHISKRVTAQQGCFTVHAYYDNRGGFLPMEKTEIAERLVKIELPSSALGELRYYLDCFGVNQAMLFPDLDGLCHHIGWTHSTMNDEAPSDVTP
jgi:hypothetical protein